MSKTAKPPKSRLSLPPKVLQKALKQSADQAQRLADAFGATVPRLKVKTAKHQAVVESWLNPNSLLF